MTEEAQITIWYFSVNQLYSLAIWIENPRMDWQLNIGCSAEEKDDFAGKLAIYESNSIRRMSS